jgi:hypothetical protein
MPHGRGPTVSMQLVFTRVDDKFLLQTGATRRNYLMAMRKGRFFASFLIMFSKYVYLKKIGIP